MKTLPFNGRDWTIRAADVAITMAQSEALAGRMELAARLAQRAARLYRRAGLGLMASRARQFAARAIEEGG